MSKYEKLDQNILSMLSERPTPVFDIWLKWRSNGMYIETIDRRMQYLRKKGLLQMCVGRVG
ncbi:Uncharacterised protein [Salmonella enterica subsp. enterica]|uniref:Uncharacterized protein n=1 Tax=Salmonella enterica I TaxID=59201 RepID=A0A379WEM3_SALET|nr:Uncharacterised protein [Salmonella enterica subsp. enterica]